MTDTKSRMTKIIIMSLSLGLLLFVSVFQGKTKRADALVEINNRLITNKQLQDVQEAYVHLGQARPDDQDIIQLIIDEELLIQRALELDLLHRNKRLRTIAVNARILRANAEIPAENVAENITEEALQRRREENLARLYVDLLTTSQIRFSKEGCKIWQKSPYAIEKQLYNNCRINN